MFIRVTTDRVLYINTAHIRALEPSRSGCVITCPGLPHDVSYEVHESVKEVLAQIPTSPTPQEIARAILVEPLPSPLTGVW